MARARKSQNGNTAELVCPECGRTFTRAAALGAQAGEARLRDVATQGGFTRFRRAAETPFNMVLEAKV